MAPEHGDCFHDGEMTWWQCVFCRRFFDLEDMEIMSGDTQGCEPCTGAWYEQTRSGARDAVCSRGDDPTGDAPGNESVA